MKHVTIRYPIMEGVLVPVVLQVPETPEEWARLTGRDPMEALNGPVIRTMINQLRKEFIAMFPYEAAMEQYLRETPVDEVKARLQAIADQLPVPFLADKRGLWLRLAQQLLDRGEEATIAALEKHEGRQLRNRHALAEALKRRYGTAEAARHAMIHEQAQTELPLDGGAA